MKDSRKIPVIGDGTWAAVVPFALITFCFALWGFANDVTTPLVKSFSKIFRMSVTEGTLVQVAFYGGYFAMAFPAAMFIRRYSYKAGVMLGLGLYALGAFLFFPAKMTGDYYPFLIAYFIHLLNVTNPVYIEMIKRQPAILVHLHYGKCRTVYRLCDAKPLCYALREHCFTHS